MIYKNQLLIFLFVITSFSFSSDNGKVNSFKIDSEDFSVDNLGFIYVLDNSILKKYNQKGDVLNYYTNTAYRNISNVDVSNPFKIILFNYDFQMLFILDNKLHLSSKIDLKELGYSNIKGVYSSFDNGFWLYDEIQNSYIKSDDNLHEIFRRKIDVKVNVKTKYVYSFSNKLYLFYENAEIFTLNNTGIIEKHSFNREYDGFVYVDNSKIYCQKDSMVSVYSLDFVELGMFSMPYNDIKKAVFKNKYCFFLRDNNQLDIFSNCQ